MYKVSINRLFGTTETKEFSSLTDFLTSVKGVAPIPPIKVEFDSKSSLDSAVNDLITQFGKSSVTNHSFTCKLNKMGLALPLKDAEIKGLEEDEYPIVLSFDSAEEIISFASAYERAELVKRVTTKNLHKKEVKQDAPVPKWAVAAIAAFALLAIGFLYIASRPSPQKSSDSYKETIMAELGYDGVRAHDISKLNGSYTKEEWDRIANAYGYGQIKKGSLSDKLLKKMSDNGDITALNGIEEAYNAQIYGASYEETASTKIPSWVYGSWRKPEVKTKTEWIFVIGSNNTMDITIKDLNAGYVMDKLHYDAVDVSGDILLYGNKGDKAAGSLKVDNTRKTLRTPSGDALEKL